MVDGRAVKNLKIEAGIPKMTVIKTGASTDIQGDRNLDVSTAANEVIALTNAGIAGVLRKVILLPPEKAKKAEEEQLKQEVAQEAERIEQERRTCERTEKKHVDRQRRDAQRDAEIDKKLEIQLAIKTGTFSDRMEANLGPVLDFVRKAKAKKQVVHVPKDLGSSESETEEIRARTGSLMISEKRKRGLERVFDDSPLMLTPIKRTPQRTREKEAGTPGRITHSKAKVKTKLSPFVEKLKKSPTQPDKVAKLHVQWMILQSFDRCYPENLVLKRTDSGDGTSQFLGFEIRTKQTQAYLGCVQLVKNEESIWTDEKLIFKNGQSYSSWSSKQPKNVIMASYLHRINQNTTIRAEIPMRVLTVKCELRLKGFPEDAFERVLKSFAVDKDSIWKWTVDLLFPRAKE
ncbi:hypothetical protein CBR_g44317 [Chara braunii]|uniref:Uncharacterized protein n=1 Tax=Chara braunii TaxID=69332 RepID=A0A388K2Z9_CHABU|nr:hypothetical protein CBR_g44317 [Chara braunii]|eukprot:GBG64432.1 hypothetical protein CBR_g44317 [Chara braunii]